MNVTDSLVPTAEYKNNKILFDEENHIYYVNKKRYFSVTQTDSTMDAFYAKKVNKHQLKNAILRGNQIHDAADLMLKKKFKSKIFFIENRCSIPTAKKIEMLEKDIFEILKDYDVLGSEMALACSSIEIAGKIDIVLRRKSDKKIFVADWKTTKFAEMDKDTRFIKFYPQLLKYAYLVERNFVIEGGVGMLVFLVGEKEVKEFDLSVDLKYNGS